MFIPSLQSISPFYFLRPSRKVLKNIYPFNQPQILYFYFARNGIYHLGHYLKQTGRQRMLFPAYNHGNEIRALLAADMQLTYYNVLPDMSIDYDDLEKKIKETNIDVLYFIHYVGLPQNLERIQALKEKHRLTLIEDNALGLFSQSQNTPLGSLGDASVFCLYKTLPIPNGGALLINNKDWSLKVNAEPPQLLSTISRATGLFFFWLDLRFRGFGRTLQKLKSNLSGVADKMEVDRVPVLDSQFDITRASWGMSRLSYFLIDRIDPQKIRAKRRANFRFMIEHIPPEFHVFSKLPDGAVPWFFPVKLPNREYVFQRLTQRGVDCARFWRHSHPDIPAEQFPQVKALRESILELPIHQDLNQKHLKFVCDQFNQVIGENG